MKEIRVYLLPHWTVSSIKEISNGNLDILATKEYSYLQGQISFRDYSDGSLCMDSFNSLLKINPRITGNNLLSTYCPSYTEYTSVEKEILENLLGVNEDNEYKIHNIADDLLVIEMLPGFSGIVTSKSNSLTRLYRDILCELLKIASFSSVAGTKLYGCYLRTV